MSLESSIFFDLELDINESIVEAHLESKIFIYLDLLLRER
jgi:hypothetical protein